MSSKQRKILSTLLVTVMSAAIFLSGTFAWQSLGQVALNEVAGLSNPGARLHDDFDGSNKDVYVENFTEPGLDGIPIFARIRLSEYMEIGKGAGDSTAVGRKAKPVGKTTAVLTDKTTWMVHKYGVGETVEENAVHDYWSLSYGGSTVFMPTFNKNKDSLAADLNGTFEGPDKDRKTKEDRYQDYVKYELDAQKTDFAVYDIDDNDVDEKENAVEGVNFEKKEETHTAKATQDGQVITMAEWKAMGSPMGKYWVYDVDGWAYWAEAIAPGEATGLLLTGIHIDRQPDDEWYYALNVEGQFATAGDWGDKTTKTGFYKDGMTEDGLFVLNQAAKRLPVILNMSVKGGVKQFIKAGTPTKLAVDMEMKNATGLASEKYVVWTSEPVTPALRGDIFTANNTMAGKTFKLTATSSFDPTKTATTEVYVYPSEATGIVKGELDNKTYIDFGDNTFKEIKSTGEMSNFICGGEDGIIGNPDDRTDVVVLDLPDVNFGSKFLGPNTGETYWAMGPDKKLGTADDIKVVSTSTWPNDITSRIADMIEITSKDDVSTIKIGKKLQMSAKVIRNGQPIKVQDVIWSVDGQTSRNTMIDEYGVLTVGADEVLESTLTVYAESKEMKGLKSAFKLVVKPLDFVDIPDVVAGSMTTVTIDGIQWYVLVKDGGEALLWAKDPVKTQYFHGSYVNKWDSSNVRSYLNSSFLTDKTVLSKNVLTKKITTRDPATYAQLPTALTTAWVESLDKVFLLSEADIYGTQGGTTCSTSEAKDYTYGSKPIVSTEMRKWGVGNGVSATSCWLRSPSSTNAPYYYVTTITGSGTLGTGVNPTTGTYGVRPALWVKYVSDTPATPDATTSTDTATTP